MRKIDRPDYTSEEALSLCIFSKTRRRANHEFVIRLQQITTTVSNGETVYANLAEADSLHTIQPNDDVDGIVSAQEMIDLYDKTFVKSKATRHIYDTIKTATKNEECPFCSQRKVSTLDHYLPKSDFSIYSITPCNLLPCCSECNKAKFTYQADNADGQLVHPYFDETNDGRWLYADVVETIPPAITFRVNPPTDWSILKKTRIDNHFELLGLSKLYSANAGSELAGIDHKLRLLFESTGPDGVNSRLSEAAESWFMIHRNCWQGAMYEALSYSDWFCSEWFLIENI